MKTLLKQTILTTVLFVGSLHATGFTTASIHDTTAPIISQVEVLDIIGTKATVKWKTNEIANSHIKFSNQSRGDLEYETDHQMVLTRLQPSTDYTVSIISTDLAGNQTTTATSFTTANSDPKTSGEDIINIVPIIMYLLH